MERSYEASDDDRRLVERSLELTSQELMSANGELRRKQGEQQVIFDSVPALIIYKDTQNRIIRLNDAAAHALGGTVATLEGRDTNDLLPPELARALYEDDLKVIRSGQPLLGIVESHPSPGGTRWMRTDKVPYRDESGQVVGVIVFSVDITERKAAEEALRASEESHRLIVETATEGIWRLDAEGRTLFANRVLAQMIGEDPATMVGRNLFEFVQAEDQGVARQAFGELVDGKTLVRDVRFRRKDGDAIWTQVSGAPMRDAKGNVIGVLGMLTDITQRKAAERGLRKAYEQLQHVDHERMQFLNNAAHELGTPLTPIKLQMRLLAMGLQRADVPAQEKAVAVLERNFDRLAHLVRDLLDSARLQASSLRLHPQVADLRDVVYASVETYLPAAQEAGVALLVDADAPSIPVRMDVGRIGQVIDNLLSNAIKFTPRGGTVEVTILRKEQAMVRVRDSGLGLRREDMGRLFQPFSQVHDTMQLTTGGTGLGLYVSRGIVESHGGQIRASSPGPHRGANFEFTLPLPGMEPVQQGRAAGAA